jgi:hypothetical protein
MDQKGVADYRKDIIGDIEIEAWKVRDFGSLGWNTTYRIRITRNGKPDRVRVYSFPEKWEMARLSLILDAKDLIKRSTIENGESHK